MIITVKIIVPDSGLLTNNEDWVSIVTNSNKNIFLGLLLEINALSYSNEEDLRLNLDIVKNQPTNQGKVSQLIGLLAEALIVQSCKKNLDVNRKWANIARRYPEGIENQDNCIHINDPDCYEAFGIGLVSTKNHREPDIRGIYNKLDSSRDICWFHKKERDIQLLMSKNVVPSGGTLAGLQIKVSHKSDGQYPRHVLLKKAYRVPIIYFDLGDDFDKAIKLFIKNTEKNFLYTKEDIFSTRPTELKETTPKYHILPVEENFIRGKEIAPDLHEKLLEYSAYLLEVLNGERTLQSLISKEPEFKTIFSMQLAVQDLKNRTPLLLVSSYP
jgi:hypothetical protein